MTIQITWSYLAGGCDPVHGRGRAAVDAGPVVAPDAGGLETAGGAVTGGLAAGGCCPEQAESNATATPAIAALKLRRGASADLAASGRLG